MKPISGKLQSDTDSYSFVKKRKLQNEDQNVQAAHGRSPIVAKKMFTSPIGDMTRFYKKKRKSIDFSDV